MDKTKRYTIIGLILCLVGIGIGSLYNTNTPSAKKIPEITEATKLTPQEGESVDEERPTQQASPQTKATTKEVSKETEKSTTTDIQKPKVLKYQVTMKIQGIDSIIGQGKVSIEAGKSVYDVLKLFAETHKISLSTSGYGKMIYIKAIQNLREFDYGPQSGWIYYVNGEYQNMGAGLYQVKEGDAIEWIYKTTQ